MSRRRLVLLGAALAIAFALLMTAAEPAHAFPSVGGMVDTAVKKIFGVKGDWITGTFVEWLIKVPDVGLTSNGGPAQVYQVTRDIAFALLGAVLTLSCIHYLVSGMTSQGGGAGVALEGALRTGGAALMIIAWPFLVDNGVTLSHIASDVLVPGDKLGDVTRTILAGSALASVFAGGVPLIMTIVVMLAFALIILIVFITKLTLGAGLIVIGSGMPLALAVWPVPSLAWVANGLMRIGVGIIFVELGWAVEFGVYARVPSDFLHWRGAGAFVDKLIAPLTMLALLMLMLQTARTILRLAGAPGGGGGFLTNTVALMASRFAMGSLSRQIPDRFGGSRDSLAQRDADRIYRDRQGAASALSSAYKATGAADRTSRKAAQALQSNEAWMQAADASLNGNGPQPTERRGGEKGPRDRRPADPPPPTGLGEDGIPTRRGHKEAHRKALERMDRLREAGTFNSPSRVADALDAVQSSGLDAGAVANHLGAFGGNDRHVMGRMADAELALGLSPEASQAFRSIGVADAGSRAAGLSLWQSRQAPSGSSGSHWGNGGSPSGGRATRPAGPPAPPPTPTKA